MRSFGNHLSNEEDLVSNGMFLRIRERYFCYLGWGKRNAIFVNEQHPETFDGNTDRMWFDDKWTRFKFFLLKCSFIDKKNKTQIYFTTTTIEGEKECKHKELQCSERERDISVLFKRTDNIFHGCEGENQTSQNWYCVILFLSSTGVNVSIDGY